MQNRWLTALVAALVFTGAIGSSLADTLIPAGSVWKYFDRGSSPGAGWRDANFNDSTWASGPAQLGYGDGGEATVISYGPVSSNKFITTYFRHRFMATDVTQFDQLRLRLLRDDGAAVYLNGVEVFRSNLPAGALENSTLALVNVGGTDEDRFYETFLNPNLLSDGANILAVELHQASSSSSDVSFDLELLGFFPPLQTEVNSPADGAVNLPTNVVLEATPLDSRGMPLSVTFSGRVTGPSPRRDFTLIAIPDTQYYVSSKNGGTPAHFTAQTDWIVRNQTARNIVFVTQLGDCVEHGDNNGDDTEWQQATNALYRLEDPQATFLAQGIPYGVAVGNHDQSPFGTPGGTTFYNRYFGEPHFAGRDYYGGHHGTNNNNHFELFSASGLDFIMVHLEYNTTPEATVLAWANDLLRTHSHRRAIIVSHYLINAGNNASFGTQGQATYDALKANPNLFLMLCGHVNPEEGQRTDIFNGNTVYTLMSDYQMRVNGGNGWLRILEFSPSNNVIRVKTYSPTLDQFEVDADSEFTLPYNMQGGMEPFTPVATNVSVPSGTRTSATWTGLRPWTTYEWQVTASDGTRTTTSAITRFVTGAPGTGRPPTSFPPVDTDRDGVSDQDELLAGTDPADAGSVLKINSLEVVGSNVRVSWNSVPGRIYRICGKLNLSDPTWNNLSGDLSTEAGVTTWSLAMDQAIPCCFYRVELVNPFTAVSLSHP